jgi:2-polyprenyl-3-methyl-5-hydroxy-6-metoxy-1,4-benzoquinol methylase
MPTDEELDEFYENFDSLRNNLGEEYNEKRKKQYLIDRDFIYNFFINKSNIKTLDFGCYDGSFLDTFDDRFVKHGVEKNKEVVEWARDNRNFGQNMHACDILDAPYTDEYFDLIIMRGVIEHLAHPNKILDKISSLLKKDGLLYICATPNAGSFSAKRFRDKWNQFTVPGHILYFSDYTLEKYLRKFGFQLLAKYFPYIETPYANPKQDLIDIQNACEKTLLFDTVNVPFYNNMMSAVFIK